MSFPRYPSYKDSGVEWLGAVPEHWTVEPFKRQIKRNDGGVWGSDPDGLNDTIVLRSTEQTVDGRWQIEDPAPRKLTESEVDDALLVEGDLLLTKSSGSSLHIGKTTLVTAEIAAMRCCYSNFMQRIRTKASFLPPLAWYAMNNDLARHQFDLFSNSTTGLANLNSSIIRQIVVTVPPPAEQTQIVAFLDRETAKLDVLVAEQRRLIDLLKEKRQAVISHAVTKGLNPNAPMKPSGIEWLGDVPAHWDVKRIKFVTESVKAGPFGSMLTKDVYTSAGYRVYGQEQVIPNDFTIGDYFIEPKKYEELSQYSVSPGDILISCVGTFGKIAIVPSNIEPGIINPRLIRLRCTGAIKAAYLVEAMRSAVTFEQFASFTRGGTMDVINIGTLNRIFLTLPSIAEQEELLEFMRHETAKLDTLTAEAQRAIDLLQERRTALISAAITGQIDVRSASERTAA